MMESVQSFLVELPWSNIVLLASTALGGLVAARLITYFVGREVDRRVDETTGLIVRRIVFYGLLAAVLSLILSQMNLSLGTLLAAGGLFGVALGFAAQTAVSNVISGLFLMFERPFEVNDVVRVDNNLGSVQSIDLLSTKLRTLDNLYWRIPNEKLLKSDIYTMTRYDIRRIDLAASISYSDDIQGARDVLLECADSNPMVMAQPEPITRVEAMADSGIQMSLRFWFHRPDFVTVISDLTQEVKVALEEAGYTIPFPHRTVYVRDEENWQEEARLMADEPSEGHDQS